MNILVTAGGTSEKIDEVRHITNHSTGGLGKMIAEAFAADQATTVTYVHGPHALTPTLKNIKLVPINSVDNLLATLTDLLTTEKFDAVIHSMAVSDYKLNSLMTQAELSQQLAKHLSEANIDFSQPKQAVAQLNDILSELTQKSEVSDKKISSQADKLMITLATAPKVIGQIKKIQPETLLVGFKLLVDVSKEHLQEVAFATLEKNNADFVLANDLTEVGPVNHIGMLVDQANQTNIFTTKLEIAQGIKQAVLHKAKGNKL